MKIKELILHTNRLEDQIDFYVNLFGFQLLQRNKQSASLKFGNSLLTFKYKKKSSPYHFACNIPSNQENEALTWLKKRVEILPYLKKEMVDFRSWNAKSIYFYDRDLNIVEFIARKNLNMTSDHDFSAESIINISEVGLPTLDLKKTFHNLNQLKNIEIYDGGFEKFMALGNEEGMFILVDPSKKKWFPINDEILLSDFKLKGDFNIEFCEGKIFPVE